MRSCGIHRREISQEIFKISILDMSLKMTNPTLQQHFPVANELTPLAGFHFTHDIPSSKSMTGLDTNGCPLGNSKFILLSDNPNICLWLSACQVEKSNQLNDSWSNIYQRLSQPEARFRKYKHLTCSALFLANSIRFILVLKRITSDWRATLDLPWLTLLFMVSIRSVLMARLCMMSCQLSQCDARVASSTEGHTLWMVYQWKIIAIN